MSSDLSDLEWIERFNEFSMKFYFERYVVMFKPSSGISNIVLPSDRHEIKIGLNSLSTEEKNQIKSLENFSEQVLGIIAVLVPDITNYYQQTKEKIIQNATKYYDHSIGMNGRVDSNDIAVRLINHIRTFCGENFSLDDAFEVIEKNESKYEHDFIKHLLGSLVPLLVEKRKTKELKENIKSIVDDFMKHDLDRMILDMATEKQKRDWISKI